MTRPLVRLDNIHLLPVRSFLLLLGDPEASVRRALLHNLAAFMEGIAGRSARDDAKLSAELAGHVASLEASLGLDWRAQQSLLLAIPALSQVAHPPNSHPNKAHMSTLVVNWPAACLVATSQTPTRTRHRDVCSDVCFRPSSALVHGEILRSAARVCRCSAVTRAMMCCCPWRCASSWRGRPCCERPQRKQSPC